MWQKKLVGQQARREGETGLPQEAPARQEVELSHWSPPSHHIHLWSGPLLSCVLRDTFTGTAVCVIREMKSFLMCNLNNVNWYHKYSLCVNFYFKNESVYEAVS